MQKTTVLHIIGVVLIAFLLGCQQSPEPQGSTENQIISVPVAQISFDDPRSINFNRAPATTIKMLPQNIIAPILKTASVTELTVRSVYNQDWIAFQLEWEDQTRNAVVDVDKFTDQVAIQFPLDPNNPPSFMMGNKDGRVHIIHWKAIWQDDIDKGYRDVQTLHPNYWVDMYFFVDEPVFAEGELPKEPNIRHFQSIEAQRYMPGIFTRNPVSLVNRTTPVEEAMAEGFGTFTTQPRQNANGWGTWQNNRWKVVIVRPLVSEDVNDAPIPAKTVIAFAVWDGGDKNIGSRKNYTPWIPLIRQIQ